jgi:hypothetical protein
MCISWCLLNIVPCVLDLDSQCHVIGQIYAQTCVTKPQILDRICTGPDVGTYVITAYFAVFHCT